jgi:RNA recognition motif-containing protein
MASARLFVGNIPYSTTEDDLRALFARCGTVANVRVIMDFGTGRSKGYGFVEMGTPQEAERAIRELNNSALGGRTIIVNEARSRSGGGTGRGDQR